MTTVDAPAATALPYRPGVGILMVDAAGRAFVARRRDLPDAWQMPQGGIDPGEDPHAAMIRELGEEIGTANVAVLAETRGWLRYDLPDRLVGVAWGGRWRGQEQKWFAARFLGRDEEIDLATAEPEFDAWRWVDPETLPDLAAPFKRRLYEQVLAEFRDVIRAAR